MPKFQIEIEEISQRVEEIEADNLEEALDKAEEKYSTEEIVLDYEDFKDYEIREYRNQVREEDLIKDNIIPLNYGQAILLEGDKNLALLKQIGKEVEPYIIVTNLQPHRKYGTYFEWDNGNHFNSITEASKEYEKRTNVNKYSNNIDFSKLEKQILENNNSMTNLMEKNLEEQIRMLKYQIQQCNDEMFDSLINKYNIFNNIKNTIAEGNISIEKFQSQLETDNLILDKIYNRFLNININFLSPTFDEVMLETFLEEERIDNLINEDELEE